jgi:hypothetical protein
VLITTYDDDPLNRINAGLDSHRNDVRYLYDFRWGRFLGFRGGVSRHYFGPFFGPDEPGAWYSDYWEFSIPFWAFVVLFALLFLRWLRQVRRGKLLVLPCPKCSYSLTGNVSGVCPECGTPIARVAF